jgi:hypothetical protein
LHVKLKPGEDEAVALEIRKEKLERLSERKRLQEKWKRRRVHFHQEQDVGNAVLHRARTVLRHKRQKDTMNAERQQKQQHQVEGAIVKQEDEDAIVKQEADEEAVIYQQVEGEEQQPLEEQHPQKELQQEASQNDSEQVNSQVRPPNPTEQDDDDVLCSSDEELELLLQRLPQSQAENEQQKDVDYAERNRQLQLEALKEAKASYAESLSGYWNQGRVAPKTRDMEFSFTRDFQPVYPDDVPSHSSSSKSRNRRRQVMQESPLLLAQLSQGELSPGLLSTASTKIRAKPNLAIQGNHSCRARPLLLGRTLATPNLSDHRIPAGSQNFPSTMPSTQIDIFSTTDN